MERLTNRQILEAGLDDWRQLAQGLHARFRTGDLASGATFVTAVAAVGQQAGHHPEVRLAPPWVELKLTTHEDGWWVTERDVDLARQISQIAAQQGFRPDPGGVAQLELALDSAAFAAQGRFWAALLTGSEDSVVHGDVMDPDSRVPNLWFQETTARGAAPAFPFRSLAAA
ncbi:MAG: 4a-hydroxytetrahydrobiopterin dehydratase [Candidatus Dormiibacterota bacterium]